jgi:hypothetical protein
MPTDPRLETYLATLERALKPLPVSDRAEIVTEIKSHALAACEREGAPPLESILAALGEPETVANRYLMERGHSPVKPPISPIVKWLVIGFLGTLALLLLFAGAVIWRLHPLLDVDGANDRVTVLGGLIHIDGKEGTGWIGTRFGDQSYSGHFPAGAAARIALEFDQGRYALRPSPTADLGWDCRGSRSVEGFGAREEDGRIRLDLRDLGDARCRIEVPAGASVTLRGRNGRIRLDQPTFSVDTELDNGRVAIHPEPGRAYRYDLSIGNGRVDAFASSRDERALPIRIRVQNGRIEEEK